MQRPAQGRAEARNRDTATDLVAGVPGTDQRTEAGGVHERDRAEVDYQQRRTRREYLGDHPLNLRGGGLQKLTVQHDDDLTGTPRLNLNRQTHRAPRLSGYSEPDPTACSIPRNRCNTATDPRGPVTDARTRARRIKKGAALLTEPTVTSVRIPVERIADELIPRCRQEPENGPTGQPGLLIPTEIVRGGSA